VVPRTLSVLLVAASACYLVDMLAAFLVPGFDQKLHALIVIPCAVAEISMVFYLLVVGVKTLKPKPRKLVPVLAR